MHRTISLFLKWFFICCLTGVSIGFICAFFLFSLNLVTTIRENNPWIIYGLPLAGYLIATAYTRWGTLSAKGNNLLIQEYLHPQQRIPFIMAPLVLLSTLLTHLFGGSAGREGTAVQIGGALADQLTRWIRFTKVERRILIAMGISAGFAAIFGTPLAGTVFGLEVLLIGKKRYWGILPCLLSALIADASCQFWNLGHAHYAFHAMPWSLLSATTVLYSILAGILFGCAAFLFTRFGDSFSLLFKKIQCPALRPVLGGILFMVFVALLGTNKFNGLGIPTIQAAFVEPAGYFDFLIKLLLTTLTLSSGFKGGEVTPLFFIGATLGSAISTFFPLPIDLLAAMGFVAVFAAATNTPLASTLMGYELFGYTALPYLFTACFIAYLCSGRKGIYTAQKGGLKTVFYRKLKL